MVSPPDVAMALTWFHADKEARVSLYSYLCFLCPNNLWSLSDRDVLPRIIVFNSLSFVIVLSDTSDTYVT